jgi:hypothetical protein
MRVLKCRMFITASYLPRLPLKHQGLRYDVLSLPRKYTAGKKKKA